MPTSECFKRAIFALIENCACPACMPHVITGELSVEFDTDNRPVLMLLSSIGCAGDIENVNLAEWLAEGFALTSDSIDLGTVTIILERREGE